MEQLSLFALDNLMDAAFNEKSVVPTPTPPVEKKASVIEKPIKPEIPGDILKRLNSITNIYELCQFAGTDYCNITFFRRNHQESIYTASETGLNKINSDTSDYRYRLGRILELRINRISLHVEPQTMVYFDQDGNPWCRQCLVTYSDNFDINYYGFRANSTPERCQFNIRWASPKWRLLSSLPTDNIIYVQTLEQRAEICRTALPYTYKFSETSSYSLPLLMLCPQVELLEKAGYEFVKSIRQYPNYYEDYDVGAFNRLIKFDRKPGKLQNIFKTTKEVCKILKNERKLCVWDQIRKLEKFSKSSFDEMRIIYDNHYSDRELASIQRVLKKEYHGKKVFTFSSLVNYLNRLDQYEAIEASEALQLLDDYLTGCSLLDMQPRIDGDSLKREHDVTARLIRNKKNEIHAKRMIEPCNKLQLYNLENVQFIIRGIRSYDDLLDEAKQQHNCVASYSSRIIEGTSLIFVLRRKTVPDRSFVTIELSPDLSTVRQKYEAHNQPLRNKEATEFINEWQAHCKAVKKGLVEPHVLGIEAALASKWSFGVSEENEIEIGIDN